MSLSVLFLKEWNTDVLSGLWANFITLSNLRFNIFYNWVDNFFEFELFEIQKLR